MKVMSCFGEFKKDDRICEMCELVCDRQYKNCKKIRQYEDNMDSRFDFVCSYRERYYYDYKEYIKCNKDNGFCNPKEKCKEEEYDKLIKELRDLKHKLTNEIKQL